MGYLGQHWILIIIFLVIVLIIWGPGKLPDVGAGLGRAIREFRKASTETHDSFTHATTAPVQPQQPQQQTTPAESTTDPNPQPADTPPQTPVTR